MFVTDDPSFFETRPVLNIRTGREEPVTLRCSQWCAVHDWAESFDMTYETALLDLQSDIAASWADIQGAEVNLEQRILCVLLYGESCTHLFGAANENLIWGMELLDEITHYNPRVPPFTLRMPLIHSGHPGIAHAGAFSSPRTD